MPRSTPTSRRSEQERADLIAALGDDYLAGLTSSQMIAGALDPRASEALDLHGTSQSPRGHAAHVPDRPVERGHAPLDRQHRTPRQGPARGHRWRGT